MLDDRVFYLIVKDDGLDIRCILYFINYNMEKRKSVCTRQKFYSFMTSSLESASKFKFDFPVLTTICNVL